MGILEAQGHWAQHSCMSSEKRCEGDSSGAGGLNQSLNYLEIFKLTRFWVLGGGSVVLKKAPDPERQEALRAVVLPEPSWARAWVSS